MLYGCLINFIFYQALNPLRHANYSFSKFSKLRLCLFTIYHLQATELLISSREGGRHFARNCFGCEIEKLPTDISSQTPLKHRLVLRSYYVSWFEKSFAFCASLKKLETCGCSQSHFWLNGVTIQFIPSKNRSLQDNFHAQKLQRNLSNIHKFMTFAKWHC